MRAHARRLVAILAPLLLGGCTVARSSGAPRRPDEERAIRTARASQNAAMEAGDADLAATWWTEDVTIRRALGQDVHGRAAYRQILAPTGNRDSSLVYQRDPESVEVSAHFPLAFESGRWAGHLGGASGPVVIGGPYSAQWVKRDGRWLIRSEVFVAMTCSGVGCGYAAVP
jgi:ketosteroid isomerase-like protein